MQVWSLTWFWPPLLILPITWLVRARFLAACVYWERKASGSLRAAREMVKAVLLIIFAGASVFYYSGSNLPAAAVASTTTLLVFGPVNAGWGLRSLRAAWNFLDSNYGLQLRSITGLVGGGVVGLILGLVLGLSPVMNSVMFIIGMVVGLFLGFWLLVSDRFDLGGP